MKIWICWATTLAIAFGWAATVHAQGFTGPPVGTPGAAPAPAPRPAAAAPAPGAIALLDVGMVFDKHARFQAEMNQMKAEVKAFEDLLRQEQATLQQMAEQIKQYQPGSDPYKKQEEAILIRNNDMKTKTQLKRKEFLEREADAYFRVYREVESVVNYYCQRNGTLLVLRYANQDINQKDRDSVLRGINRPIVYRNPTLDITGVILAQLNPQGAVGGAPVAPAGPGPVGPPGGQANRPQYNPQPVGQPNFK